MTNEEIIGRLKRSDLTQVKNIQALFDMARNTDDLELCKYARNKAQALAGKGDLDAYELVRETYLWAAPRDFDSYLIYLEWNRRAEERFYLPRRKQLRGNVEALQDLADDKLDELFLSMPPRVGKLLADSTPVLTVDGWKNHGDLKVGDYVFSPDGAPVRVIAVHPKHHTTHTVTMTDGSSFKCHFRHEWKVYNRKKNKIDILETQAMIGNLCAEGKCGENGCEYNYEIADDVQIAMDDYDRPSHIFIRSIVESEPEPGNCITVEGGMYLVGRHLIPTHNTSLLMFYMTWQMGRDSERSNLYCAYSDTITNAFYNGVLEILNDPKTYLWRDVFPEHKIAATNSKNETINIDRNKRYASLTCRSLYGTLNGSVDADGTLVSDDLLSGIEEALNKDRLVSVWSKVDNNMLTRAKGKAKILWCGTRWSMIDPIGLRIDTVSNNEKFKGRRVRIINTPALNEKDESNFEYLYGVGFSSGMYQQRRASFERNNDMASWLAQYMGEPIERDGAVFSPQDFRYYNGVLPDIEPDRIFAACDPSWGGGDYTAMPICYKYGNDIYVADVVYDNGDKRVTQRLVADKAAEHNVAALQIEATKTTEEYAEGVDRLLRDSGRKINLTTKTAARTVGGKQQRIFDKAPDIRERMIFLENGKRSKPYQLFMQNVFSFKVIGKNKNDDAPDSLCMAIEMDASTGARAVIIDRLW